MATDRTRVIAGVSVPDSPLITDVLDYAEKARATMGQVFGSKWFTTDDG